MVSLYPRNPMFSEWEQGSLAIVDEDAATTARYIYCHSGTGTDEAGAGIFPDKPVATIDYAISLGRASRGDTVIVMEGHAENITTATAINADVIGIQIIGIGDGALIPTVSMTHLNGSVTIAVASVLIKNIRFVANIASGVATALTIAEAGHNFTLEDCYFVDTTTDKEFLIHASVGDAVVGLTVINNRFNGLAGTMSGSFVFAGTSVDLDMAHNYWRVDSSDSVIFHDTDDATNVHFHHNTVINIDTGAAGYCVEFTATSTGTANDNHLAYDKVDAEVWKGDGIFWFENYMNNTIAESGRMKPTSTHAIP